MGVKNDALTIEEFICSLMPRFRRRKSIPKWPPDAFAICAGLLIRSGSYSNVLSAWPPTNLGPGEWNTIACKLGLRWRVSWVNGSAVPIEISKAWNRIITKRAVLVDKLRDEAEIATAILVIAAIADQACEGVGNQSSPDQDKTALQFHLEADRLLQPGDSGSSLGREVHTSRMRILPKMHTPQNGLTVRSLSLYLAICNPGEVVPYWTPIINEQNSGSLNILLIPWPFSVSPSHFREATPLDHEMENMPNDFGFFTYDPPMREGPSLLDMAKQLYAAAVRAVGRIDGLLLPELAVTSSEWQCLSDWAVPQKLFLAAGVGTPSSDSAHATNSVRMTFPVLGNSCAPVVQEKHHRWKLDRSQLVRYGLGGSISPERKWWEHISLNNRRFHFLSHLSMVISVLICEDLARPDPIGDLLRAVGPNLVIALLMDGPQISSRWAARYATTLADDPGCSVLSITSLGMALLSKPRDGQKASRIVALWKDSYNGLQEIALDEGCEAIVLTLTTSFQKEWSADGRSDEGCAAYPILSGVHCIQSNVHDKI